tara:strand:+ start:529 stop:936 length:408 start_codon:yes stop_codon:yes gene_type:complete
MITNKDSYDTKIAATCILLSVANADENLHENELKIINDIIKDYFSIKEEEAIAIIAESKKLLTEATDLFQFGLELDKAFSKDDKIDFIGCVFEVAFADGELHYLEQHSIKKIANLLKIRREEIINIKSEIKSYLN